MLNREKQWELTKVKQKGKNKRQKIKERYRTIPTPTKNNAWEILFKLIFLSCSMNDACHVIRHIARNSVEHHNKHEGFAHGLMANK